MKKVLFLLMAVIAFSACEGPAGPPGLDADLYWHIEDFPVGGSANKWTYVSDPDGYNPHYKCEIRFSQMTEDQYYDGIINGYIYIDPNNLSGGYLPLLDYYPVDEGPDYIESGVSFSYICYPGGITFTARNNDFNLVESDEWHPGYQVFRVVLSRPYF